MATSTEIKQRANALADKTDVNSITPKEVGGIMYDLASHSENVLRNGGTLGIRKVYESVAAMEADSTNPKDFWGDPIKKGNLVVIYDGTTTGVDNNKIYAFMNPGWELATHLDAGYATKAETDAKLAELGSETSRLNSKVSEIDIPIESDFGIILGSTEIGEVCQFVIDPSSSWKHAIFEIKTDGVVYLTCEGGFDDRAYALLDSSNILLEKSPGGAAYENYPISVLKNQKIVINAFADASYEAVFKSNDYIELFEKTKKAVKTNESLLRKKENLSGRLISVKNAIEGSNVVSSSNIIITGKNILDSTTAKKNTIKNDSGVEVYDAASTYYTHYIPVEPGMTLISAFNIERYYKYDNNKSFISRTSSIQKGIPFTIPSGVYWIQIQTVEFENPRMIVYGSTLPEYEAFISNTEKKAYSTMNIYNEEGSVIDVKVNKYFDLKDLDSKVTYLSDKSNVKDVIIEKKGEIVSITDDLVKKVNSIESNNGITMVGKNIFDSSTSKRNYIINDAGVEIYDGVSTYYQHYIPCHGKVFISNFKVQRYYLYGKDKNFLRRTDSFLPGKLYVVPNEAYFVRVQVEPTEYDLTNKMIIYNGVGDVNIYEPYKVLTDVPNSAFNIYLDGTTKISVLLNVTCMKYIPEVGEYEYWEPDEVTNDYSCPIGQGTQSVEGLTYELLLTNYFDIYINKKYSDGYTVTKKGLGNDSANNETNPFGNEVFMYDFKPKFFNHTVLISAGMNACELSGIFGLAYFIKALMEQQEEGMKALYNTTRFVVIPCICPSCLNSSPIKYTNFNGVRINKNFNYKGSWGKIKETYPNEPVGSYPDSEVETVMLKKWINDYPNADLWIDCHSDAGSRGYTNLMTQVICSDSTTVEQVRFYWSKMRQFYIDKGYITEQTEVSQQAWVESGTGYPKTLYSKHICNTSAIMIEQYISSTTYGSDGETNNDSYGIKNYTSLLRAYTLAVCRSEAEIL